MRLGVIQDVKINDEGYKTDIWFVKEHVRNVKMKDLKKHDFKVAKELVKAGYEISNEEEFDKELKMLLMKEGMTNEVNHSFSP